MSLAPDPYQLTSPLDPRGFVLRFGANTQRQTNKSCKVSAATGGSPREGEPVHCQGGGCIHFPREGVRVSMREGTAWRGRPGPYRARITDTSAPPGRNAHSPCGRRQGGRKEEDTSRHYGGKEKGERKEGVRESE